MWPFETLVVGAPAPRGDRRLGNVERDALADVLKRLTTRYDNLFETPFPYSMGVHQQPIRDTGHDWHLHLHFYPPLLRSATIRKFMVGFEMLGSPQRDFSPRGRRGAAAGGGGDALSDTMPALRRDHESPRVSRAGGAAAAGAVRWIRRISVDCRCRHRVWMDAASMTSN